VVLRNLHWNSTMRAGWRLLLPPLLLPLLL
jgi:hypothetical protein